MRNDLPPVTNFLSMLVSFIMLLLFFGTLPELLGLITNGEPYNAVKLAVNIISGLTFVVIVQLHSVVEDKQSHSKWGEKKEGFSSGTKQDSTKHVSSVDYRQKISFVPRNTHEKLNFQGSSSEHKLLLRQLKKELASAKRQVDFTNGDAALNEALLGRIEEISEQITIVDAKLQNRLMK